MQIRRNCHYRKSRKTHRKSKARNIFGQRRMQPFQNNRIGVPFFIFASNFCLQFNETVASSSVNTEKDAFLLFERNADER